MERPVTKIMLYIGAALLFFVLKLGVIFIILAMLPTIVAYFIDITPGKQVARVVGACNLAAALPTILPLLQAGIRMERIEVTSIMSNPLNWLIIYGGAAGGWGLIFLCQFISKFFVVVYLEYKVASLGRFQQRLLDEWGQQITSK